MGIYCIASFFFDTLWVLSNSQNCGLILDPKPSAHKRFDSATLSLMMSLLGCKLGTVQPAPAEQHCCPPCAAVPLHAAMCAITAKLHKWCK